MDDSAGSVRIQVRRRFSSESDQGWLLPRAAPALRTIYITRLWSGEMKILVAVDDDSLCRTVVDFVAKVFSHHATIVKLLHVVQPSPIVDTATSLCGHGENHQILEERLQKASEFLNTLRKDLRSKMLPSEPVEVSVLLGTPHRVILDCAEEFEADLIVIGSHGHGDLSRLKISSVSYAVLSHADCAVTIVKAQQVFEKEDATEIALPKSARLLA